MRAVTQNRRMAAAMGIRTPWIDALTFGLGSGVAGMAGVALSQIDNVSPNLGQGYIIDSFMVVVFGGVGNLWGTAGRRADAGHRQQVPGAGRRRGAGQDRRAGPADPVHPAPPARHVPAQGPGGRSMKLDRTALLTHRCWCWAARCCWRCSISAPRRRPPLHVPTYVIALVGKYLCYAMLALAVDLVWGFAGILSLGHAAFFALGGYAMGMYLMRQIGARGVYGNPILPDFMVFLGWQQLPWYWYGFDWFGFAAADGRAGARRAGAGVRLAGVPLARHRRLSVDHHPGADLRAAAGVLPQRHGLRRQQRHDRLQGHPRLPCAGRSHALRPAGDHRAVPVRAVPGGALRGDVALRQGADRGARHRIAHAVPRLPAGILQAGGVGAVGDHGRHRRRAVCAAGRHHQSQRVRAGQLDRGGDLGRGRRPRHAGRARSSARCWSISARPGSPARCRSSGCSRWARCSSSSRCSCRAASWACSRRARRRPAGGTRPPAVAAAQEVTG